MIGLCVDTSLTKQLAAATTHPSTHIDLPLPTLSPPSIPFSSCQYLLSLLSLLFLSSVYLLPPSSSFLPFLTARDEVSRAP